MSFSSPWHLRRNSKSLPTSTSTEGFSAPTSRRLAPPRQRPAPPLRGRGGAGRGNPAGSRPSAARRRRRHGERGLWRGQRGRLLRPAALRVAASGGDAPREHGESARESPEPRVPATRARGPPAAERDRWRRLRVRGLAESAGPRAPPRPCPLQPVRPVACPTGWLRTLSPQLGGQAPPHPRPLIRAALVRDVPEVLRGGWPVASLAVGGTGEWHGTAGGRHAAAPSLGNSPGRDFLKPRGVAGGRLAWRPEGESLPSRRLAAGLLTHQNALPPRSGASPLAPGVQGGFPYLGMKTLNADALAAQWA